MVFGGTSVSAPILAGYTRSRNSSSLTYGSYSYSHSAACWTSPPVQRIPAGQLPLHRGKRL
jgi:hypothetical protein